MPPTERLVARFAAEPPQEQLPKGEWAITLQGHFLDACKEVDTEGEELGAPGIVSWYPDRTWNGRTYVPATSLTKSGFELYGHVSFARDDDGQPTDFKASADFTAETAAQNPDWELDLCEDVIGKWRGERNEVAEMTLVWGLPLLKGGAIVTAELADLAVDQCELVDGRFTLIAPDAYRHDILDIKLFNRADTLLCSESLYEDDDEDESEE